LSWGQTPLKKKKALGTEGKSWGLGAEAGTREENPPPTKREKAEGFFNTEKANGQCCRDRGRALPPLL